MPSFLAILTLSGALSLGLGLGLGWSGAVAPLIAPATTQAVETVAGQRGDPAPL